MRRLVTSLALTAFALATGPAAQSPAPRSPERVDAGASGIVSAIAVASGGDLSATCFQDKLDLGVYVTTSDGRGLTWSTPLRVDNDPTAAFKGIAPDGIVVSDPHVYAFWRDDRIGVLNSELHFNRSVDGGATWATETILDKGSPPGTARVSKYRIDVSPDPAGDHLYALLSSTAGSALMLYATASHDGGVTFGPAVALTSLPAQPKVDNMAVASDGLTVHAVWEEDRSPSTGDDDVFYRRSLDGGATWGPRLKLDGSLAGDAEGGLFVRCDGALVAVGWLEENISATNEEVRCAVSVDSGTSFGQAQLVMDVSVASVDADQLSGHLATGAIVLAWRDNRSGLADEVQVARSTDNGATWSANVALSAGSGVFPALAGEGDVVRASWTANGGPLLQVESALSLDGGATFGPPVVLSDPSAATSSTPAAYNALYDNFVDALFVTTPTFQFEAHTGGHRTPTLTPNGFTGGPTTVSFDLSSFDGTAPFGFVVASGSPGTFPLAAFGDARDLGLTFDALFGLSIANPALFLTTIDATGSGTTATFPVDLNGIQIHAAAISFDLALAVGEITDAVLIDIP